MTISDEISIIANKLANQGKKPTVALIKTKLTSQVPLPTIIQTLKSWQHDPEFIVLASKDKEDIKTENIDNTEETKMLNQAISLAIKPLQNEIEQLKAQVATLMKKVK